MLSKFIQYYKPHWKLFLLDIISAFIISGLDLVFPVFIQKMIDDYFPNKNIAVIIKLSILLFILYIIRLIFQYIVHYWGHVVGIRMEADMRRDLFSHLQTLSFKFYDNNKIGYLMSRIVNDLNNVSELAHHGPEELFISSILIFGSFFILLNMNWRLTLFTFSVVPVMLCFSVVLGNQMLHSFKDIREKIAEVSSQIEDSLSGIRVVKSFTNEDFENKKFEHGNLKYSQSREFAMKTMGKFYSGMNFLSNMISLITLAAGAYYIYIDQLTTGELMAFLFYVNMFMNPIRRLVNFNEQFQRGTAGFSRFIELLNVKREIKESPGARDITEMKGRIVYKRVGFSYDHDTRVFENINLLIEPGQKIAFVGPSGAGKTTLCNLLPRFYEIDSGEIKIDGINIKNISISSLRRNIGIVQQDVFLFNGSVRDNIAYGKPGAGEEEIIDAAKRANADNFIIKLSDGYETNIGERGVKLSGGQKQRISIARAFLKNPPILILDEATSSLDSESEKIIQKSLKELSKGRTTLIIAHRLSTIKDADKIVVLTDVGIIEEGKHSELLERDSIYKQLYTSQFEELVHV